MEGKIFASREVFLSGAVSRRDVKFSPAWKISLHKNCLLPSPFGNASLIQLNTILLNNTLYSVKPFSSQKGWDYARKLIFEALLNTAPFEKLFRKSKLLLGGLIVGKAGERKVSLLFPKNKAREILRVAEV